MGTVVQNAGSGSFGPWETWDVSGSATPVSIADLGVSAGDISLAVVRTPDTDYVIDNDITLTHPRLGTTRGIVNQVSLESQRRARLTLDGPFGRFLTGGDLVPAVESGSPLAALDMAMRLTGLQGCTDTARGVRYWRLLGHSFGTDWLGARVRPEMKPRIAYKPNDGYPGQTEPVVHGEYRNAAIASDFGTALLPKRVLGSTPKLDARTYVRFQTGAGSAESTFTFTTGPDLVMFPPTDQIANNVYTVTVKLDVPGTRLWVTINYRTAYGTTTVAGGNVLTTGLTLTGRNTVAIETYLTAAGALTVKAGAIDEAGNIRTPFTVATTPSTTTVAPLFANQWQITASNDAGIQHLTTREVPLGQDVWAAWFTKDYVAADSGYSHTLTSLRQGAPIAAFDGEVWDYLKQVCSGRGVQLRPLEAGGFVMEEVGTRTLDLTANVTVNRSISTASAGRNIAIVNHNTSVVGTPAIMYDAETVHSVDVGERAVILLNVEPGASLFYQPRVAHNTKANYTFVWPFGATQPDLTYGYYYVMARDNLPVSPTQWVAFGGGVEVDFDEDGRARLTLIGPRETIPGVEGPFRFGESDGQTAYPVLRVAGLGVQQKPGIVRLPTGANPARTRVELATTITNVAIGDIGAVYDRGAWAAVRAAGPTVNLSATVPIRKLTAFGVAEGSLVKWEDAIYRVDTVRYTHMGLAAITASKHVTVADVDAIWAGKTIAEFNTLWAGGSLGDVSLRPLRKAAAGGGVAPVITTHPANRLEVIGTNASFTAAASGTPTPTVQWQESANGTSGWTNISGATSTTLIRPTPAEGLIAYYRAVFTNASGSATSNSAIHTGTFD